MNTAPSRRRRSPGSLAERKPGSNPRGLQAPQLRGAVAAVVLVAAGCGSTPQAVRTGAPESADSAQPSGLTETAADVSDDVLEQPTPAPTRRPVGHAAVTLPDCPDAPAIDPECDDVRGHWALHPDYLSLPPDTALAHVFVAYPQRGCGLPADGSVGLPRIDYFEDRIEVDVRLADRLTNRVDDIACAGFPAHEVVLEFDESVGDRAIVAVRLAAEDWLGQGPDEFLLPQQGVSLIDSFNEIVVDGWVPVLGLGEHSDTVPAGSVVRTDPLAGEARLPKGSTVIVIPSLGAPPPQLSEDAASGAEVFIGEFIDALRRGDQRTAQSMWSGYPVRDAEADAEFDRFVDDFAWLATDENLTVTVVPSFAFVDAWPIVTVVSGDTNRVGSFVLSQPGDGELRIERLPAPPGRVQPVQGSDVRPGDTVTLNSIPVEGGARAFLDGQEIGTSVDHGSVTTSIVLPDQLPETVVITVSMATPELPTALSVTFHAPDQS